MKRLTVLVTAILAAIPAVATEFTLAPTTGACTTSPLTLIPTAEVLCAPPFGRHDITGSTGHVSARTDNGRLIIEGELQGLRPESRYVLILMNLRTPGAGGWEGRPCRTNGHPYGPHTTVGRTTTDADGHAVFTIYDLELADGTTNLSLWVNDARANASVLVSPSFACGSGASRPQAPRGPGTAGTAAPYDSTASTASTASTTGSKSTLPTP